MHNEDVRKADDRAVKKNICFVAGKIVLATPGFLLDLDINKFHPIRVIPGTKKTQGGWKEMMLKGGKGGGQDLVTFREEAVKVLRIEND